MPLATGNDGTPVTTWAAAPFAAFLLQLIGFCLSPVSPALTSVILSALPARQHAPMAGLIVIFSALGGTSGSILPGTLFELVGGQSAFYFSLVPIALITSARCFVKRLSDQQLEAANCQ